jgi:hypothetical protein
MAFGESTIDMAKALATRISPKDLNWRYCAVGIPDSAPADGAESTSQLCCDKVAKTQSGLASTHVSKGRIAHPSIKLEACRPTPKGDSLTIRGLRGPEQSAIIANPERLG